MKSETKSETTETMMLKPSLTYCETLGLVCECGANDILPKDEETVLSLTEHLMVHPEDVHYLDIELKRAVEKNFVQ